MSIDHEITSSDGIWTSDEVQASDGLAATSIVTLNEGPKRVWTMSPREARYGTFKGAICLDIWFPGPQGKSKKPVHCRRECREEADLVTLTSRDLGQYSTKIIICLRARDPRDGLLPIPLNEETYMELSNQFQFSPLLFQVLHTGLATTCRYTLDGLEQCIFQQNATGKCSMSMVITYIRSRRSTTALIFGTSYHEANALIDLLLERHRYPHWSALPLTALELTADDFSDQIKLRHNDIWKLGNSLKLDAWADDYEDFNIKTLDLIGAIRSLNSLFVELAYYSQACQTSQSLLSTIENMLNLYGIDLPDAGRILSAPQAFKADIHRLRSWYDGIQARSDYLTRRAEVQLQTVYSLVSQRDSAINLEIAQRSSQVAEQSMAVAELSRKDNLAMREVAIAALKDSATMRVIAAVTLFFLPPTFLATLFSTSFVDFKPSVPNSHVSDWIWLYFVATLAMIGVVMTYWKMSTRHALKNIPKIS